MLGGADNRGLSGVGLFGADLGRDFPEGFLVFGQLIELVLKLLQLCQVCVHLYSITYCL